MNMPSSEILRDAVGDGAERYSHYRVLRRGRVYVTGSVIRHGRRCFAKSAARPDADAQALLALRKEYELLTEMDHPLVVSAVDLVDLPGAGLTLVTRYVDGVTLHDWLAGRPGLRARRRVGRQILEAMRYVHGKGVVHGDLSPYNIMVTGGDRPEIRIVDFGLSDAMDYEILKRGGGTAGFCSPEMGQDGHEVCARDDVYSLGVILRSLHAGPSLAVAAWRMMAREARRRPDDAKSALRLWQRMKGLMWTGVAASAAVILCVVIGESGSEKRTDVRAAVTVAAPADSASVQESEPLETDDVREGSREDAVARVSGEDVHVEALPEVEHHDAAKAVKEVKYDFTVEKGVARRIIDEEAGRLIRKEPGYTVFHYKINLNRRLDSLERAMFKNDAERVHAFEREIDDAVFMRAGLVWLSEYDYDWLKEHFKDMRGASAAGWQSIEAEHVRGFRR